MAREVLNTPKTLTLKTLEKSSCVNSTAGLTTDTPAFFWVTQLFSWKWRSEVDIYSNETDDIAIEIRIDLFHGFIDGLRVSYVAFVCLCLDTELLTDREGDLFCILGALVNDSDVAACFSDGSGICVSNATIATCNDDTFVFTGWMMLYVGLVNGNLLLNVMLNADMGVEIDILYV